VPKKRAESATFTPFEKMSNILLMSGRSSNVFGYNPVSCAWYEHAINGQCETRVARFYNCHQVRNSERKRFEIAIKHRFGPMHTSCPARCDAPVSGLSCRYAGWGLRRRSCAVERARMCDPRSMAACGVWSGCRGQVAPDVKTNRAFAARYAAPEHWLAVRFFERCERLRGKALSCLRTSAFCRMVRRL
jgi:hypothetical protein